MQEFFVRLFTFSVFLLVSVAALLAHAERLPHPPGPAYGGFIPDNWTPGNKETLETGCN
jgi:hypothetical protein